MASSSSQGMYKWLGLALALVLLDQFTKALILAYYHYGDVTHVTGFLNIVRAHNSGAAFSFLAGAGGWQRWFFLGIGIAAAVFIVYLLRTNPGQRLFSLAMACILGGAIGNVVDRMVHGYVVDFIDFHIGRWHFPAFNVADSAITIGVILMLVDEVLRVRRART